MTLGRGDGDTQRSFISQMVDEVWHAVFQAIYKGVEGVEWEHSYFQFVEVNKDIKARHPSGSSKAEMLWKMRDAKDRGDTHTMSNPTR